MRLSIIMPVYNTVNYLDYSLNSILNQNLSKEDYELIIINDGSTDGSTQLLEQYSKKWSNIRLIHQENQGESASRNRAIALARGNYIAFVDSDDAIYEDTLTKILENAEKNDLDIQYMNIHSYDDKGNFRNDTPPVGTSNVILSGLVHPRRTFPATLYKSNLAKKISFPSGVIIGPDTVFNVQVQAFAKRVSYIELPYYKYTYREDSLSKQGKSDRAFNGFVNAIKIISEFQNKNFDKSNLEANNYFNNVYEIFVCRILELNVMPFWDKKKYLIMHNLLKVEGLLFILDRFSKKYPYSNKSYLLFKLFQNYLQFKSKIYFLIKN